MNEFQTMNKSCWQYGEVQQKGITQKLYFWIDHISNISAAPSMFFLYVFNAYCCWVTVSGQGLFVTENGEKFTNINYK